MAYEVKNTHDQNQQGYERAAFNKISRPRLSIRFMAVALIFCVDVYPQFFCAYSALGRRGHEPCQNQHNCHQDENADKALPEENCFGEWDYAFTASSGCDDFLYR